MSKDEMHPDVDFVDLAVRQETMNTVPGAPCQIQLGIVPCYGLTGTPFFLHMFNHFSQMWLPEWAIYNEKNIPPVHKTQALLEP